MPRPQPPNYLLLGEILRPHGVRGEMRMKILTDYPERIQELDTVYLSTRMDDPQPQPYTIAGTRFHKQYLLLTLREVNGRDEAGLLRQHYVMVDLDNAIPLDEGEFYLYELIGLEVLTDTGDTLGNIDDVIETGANDVYVVNSPRHGELLIPAHEETIQKIDLEAGTVTVKLPDGLL